MSKLLVIIAIVLSVAPEADAVVGRPLTPVSYAGVARRTTRRTAYAAAATAPVAVAAAPVVATTAIVSTLPAGCTHVVTNGAAVYTCGGGVRYAPYYNGTTLVYQRL